MNKLKTKQQGFTIIEVMIVLVIAAVILLIVFLAVPALQRNSRNNQRKNDASRALSAITEWSNNNNGKLPSTSADFDAAKANVKLGFYTDDNFTGSTSGTNDGNPETLTLVSGTCVQSAGVNTGDATYLASSRRFVVLYTVETGSGTQKQCTES